MCENKAAIKCVVELIAFSIISNLFLSLNTVVLNRDCQGKLWLPKDMAKSNLKTIVSQKLSINVLAQPYQG